MCEKMLVCNSIWNQADTFLDFFVKLQGCESSALSAKKIRALSDLMNCMERLIWDEMFVTSQNFGM
jgi:hypothetical protein